MNAPFPIAVIYNLPSRRSLEKGKEFIAAETDTADSAKEVAEAIRARGEEVVLVPIAEDAIDHTLRGIAANLIVNLIEWSGEDIPLSFHAMDVLGSLGIPYTGVTPDVYKATSDKVCEKKAFSDHAIPTAPYVVFTTGRESIPLLLPFPVITKLANEQSSVGLSDASICYSKEALQKQVAYLITTFHQAIIAEEYIQGREIHVTVLEGEKGPYILPPSEVFFSREAHVQFLTYDSRWNEKSPEYHGIPVVKATLSSAEYAALEKASLDAFRCLSFRDYARCDFRLRDGTPYLLEINSNPGLCDDPDNAMTVSYRAAGMTFADVISSIITSCRRRSTKG